MVVVVVLGVEVVEVSVVVVEASEVEVASPAGEVVVVELVVAAVAEEELVEVWALAQTRVRRAVAVAEAEEVSIVAEVHRNSAAGSEVPILAEDQLHPKNESVSVSGEEELHWESPLQVVFHSESLPVEELPEA